MGYESSTCGQWHHERPTSFKFPFPESWQRSMTTSADVES
jgi:hypothetical protein